MIRTKQSMNDPGTTRRDVAAVGIPLVAKTAGSDRQPGTPFRKLLVDYPFHSAAILAPMTASLVISVGAGLTLARGIMPSIGTNLPAMSLAVAGLTFSLTATLTISTLRALGDIKDEMKAWRAEGRSASANATEHDAEQHVTLGAVEALGDRIGDLTSHLLNRMSLQGPQVEVRKNCVEAWSIAPRSDYTAGYGSLRLDIDKKRGPSGVRYEFDHARIRAIHLPRYHPDNAGRVTIILPAPRDDEGINEASLTHLLLYRQIEQTAEELGVPVDFSKVQFALVDGPVSQKAFFIGSRMVGGQSTPFVNSYTDWYNALQVPRSMVDDLVEVSMDASIVDAYRNTAKAIVDRASVYSLVELEERFAPHLPPRLTRRTPPVAKAAQDETELIDFVAVGDHFSWPESNGR